MKNFVSLNFKYYKDSNSSGVLGHINRQFKTNKNTFPKYTKNNFGDDNLLSKYKELKNRVVVAKGKSIRKDATTILDGVLAFSLEQFETLEQQFAREDLQHILTEYTREFMNQLKIRYGLEPIGFQFHLDEGHNKNNLIRNIHAHLSFYNYDFKLNRARWRELKRNDFSEMQSLAGEIFDDLGFKRGISKEITKQQHLKKDQFISEKQQKQIKQNKAQISQLTSDIFRLETEFDITVKRLKSKIKSIISNISTLTQKLLISAQNKHKQATSDASNSLVNEVDKLSDIELDTGIAVANEVKKSIKNHSELTGEEKISVLQSLSEKDKVSKYKPFSRKQKPC